MNVFPITGASSPHQTQPYRHESGSILSNGSDAVHIALQTQKRCIEKMEERQLQRLPGWETRGGEHELTARICRLAKTQLGRIPNVEYCEFPTNGSTNGLTNTSIAQIPAM